MVIMIVIGIRQSRQRTLYPKDLIIGAVSLVGTFILFGVAQSREPRLAQLKCQYPSLVPVAVLGLAVLIIHALGSVFVFLWGVSKLLAVFDISVTPITKFEELENRIKQWCKEAGEDVSFEFLEMKIEKEIFPSGTDSRFLRELGYPAIGFSPMNTTLILLHNHNEFLNEVFLRGIDIYCEIIPALANLEPF